MAHGEVEDEDEIEFQLARLTRLVNVVKSPGLFGPANALQLILDTAELVAGDSAMEQVAGVLPTVQETVSTGAADYEGDGVAAELVDVIDDELSTEALEPVQEALNAVLTAQVALRASLRAIGRANAANTSTAGIESAKAAQAAKLAREAAFPSAGTLPTDLERRALLEAEDGASAAANVAEVSAGLTENREGKPRSCSMS